MSRGLSGALLTHFSADHIISIVLIELSFDSGTQRYHTGIGDITYRTFTYVGIGTLGQIEPILEDQGIKMKGVRVALQGVDTTVIDLTSNEDIQGRAARIDVAAYDYETATIIDGFEIFSGTMDTSEITRGENASLVLTLESIMSQFDLPNVRRFTDEDHKTRHPNDEFFSLLVTINEQQIVWGAQQDDTSGVPGGGGGRGGRSDQHNQREFR